MSGLIKSFGLALALWCAGGSWAAEYEVEVAPGVSGKLVVPDAGDIRRAVVLYHGFNGSMDEVGNLFSDLAAALAERNIASLRFDFSGEGEREKFVVTSTFASRVGEASAAFELLRDRVPDATYGAVGFSLGGLTAMGVIDQQPDWFDSLVLWSAAQEMNLARDPAGAAAVREALETGRGVMQTYAPITLTRDFVLSFIGVNGAHGIAKYPGSLLAIRGDQDFLPTYDPAWLASSPSTDKAFLMVGGADHIFNVLEDPRPAIGARVIEATAAWFDRTL